MNISPELLRARHRLIDRKTKARLVAGFSLYGCLYLAFTTASLLLPANDNMSALLLSAIVGALVAVLAVFYLCELFAGLNYATTLIVTGVTVDVLYNILAHRHHGSDLFDTLHGAGLQGLANIGLLIAATGAGLLAARGLQHPNYLVMAAVVGALTDIFSVYHGPTKIIISTQAFPYMSYHWGLIGGGGIAPCVGIGDFLFLALYLAGASKFGLNRNSTLVAMCAAFVLGFLTLLVSPGGIPALPFMSAALLATHWKSLRAPVAIPATI